MIARDISEAASYFAFYRLPEFYAGIKRKLGRFPVQYLGANVPQAWAAGTATVTLRFWLMERFMCVLIIGETKRFVRPSTAYCVGGIS